MIKGLELNIRALIAWSLGRNPNKGGMPASESRRRVIMVLDWGFILARWV